MDNFNFQNPTKILFGKGKIKEIRDNIPAEAKILFMYGGGSIKKNGVYKQIISALEGFAWSEFSGVAPNPTYDQLMPAVEKVKQENFDFLLAVGGGSVIDGAKFVAAAACFEGDDPWDILANGAKVKSALPIGAILTLPATGTESNGNSVVTRGEDKLAFSSPKVYPAFSVLDPETTFTMPKKQIGNGVVDAYVHVMEQYLTYPANAPIQDRFAESILQTLIEQGPKALANPEDYDARANVMWSATMALNGLIGAGVPQDWATHMIGHELTALYGLDHAQTLAVVLPNVMQVQREKKRAKLLQYASRVWNIDVSNEDKAIDHAIEKTRSFFESMGVPTRLKDYELGADVIPKLVSNLEKHGLKALGEHQDIDLEKSEEILSKAV